MRVSGGRFFRSVLAVKPVRETASGPTARLGFLNESVVSQSTIMRAARSLALQMIAESAEISPEATPPIAVGRCGKPTPRNLPCEQPASVAAAEVVRNVRRVSLRCIGRIMDAPRQGMQAAFPVDLAETT